MQRPGSTIVHTDHKIRMTNLPAGADWRSIKDFLREAGEPGTHSSYLALIILVSYFILAFFLLRSTVILTYHIRYLTTYSLCSFVAFVGSIYDHACLLLS